MALLPEQRFNVRLLLSPLVYKCCEDVLPFPSELVELSRSVFAGIPATLQDTLSFQSPKHGVERIGFQLYVLLCKYLQ